MNRICVFCGSSKGINPNFVEMAVELGKELTKRDIGLVYGGSGVGLMKIIADSVLHGGGEVTGVIPQSFVEKEIAHKNLTELHVVNTMQERKTLMAELSDGFIAMPGALGTLDEIFEVLTWEQLGIHKKPCGFLNVDHYYDKLFEFLEHAVAEKLLKAEYFSIIMKDENPAELLNMFELYRSPNIKKWIRLNDI